MASLRTSFSKSLKGEFHGRLRSNCQTRMNVRRLVEGAPLTMMPCLHCSSSHFRWSSLAKMRELGRIQLAIELAPMGPGRSIQCSRYICHPFKGGRAAKADVSLQKWVHVPLATLNCHRVDLDVTNKYIMNVIVAPRHSLRCARECPKAWYQRWSPHKVPLLASHKIFSFICCAQAQMPSFAEMGGSA